SADLQNISVQLGIESFYAPKQLWHFSANWTRTMLSPRLHLKCRGRGSGGTKSNLVPYSLISRLSRRLIVDAWQATQRCRPIDADRLMQTYRLNAEKCLVLARSFNDRERRLALLDMANAWLTLTERHLRNREAVLVYAIPTPLNEPPPPADQPPKP